MFGVRQPASIAHEKTSASRPPCPLRSGQRSTQSGFRDLVLWMAQAPGDMHIMTNRDDKLRGARLSPESSRSASGFVQAILEPTRGEICGCFIRCVEAILIAILLSPLSTSAQSSLEEEDEDPFLPGLAAVYADDTGEMQCIARRIAMPVSQPAGASFRARWRGYLESEVPGPYQLAVYACGQVTVRLQGRTLIDIARQTPGWLLAEPVELAYDFHPLEVDFKATGNGEIRLFWSGPGFQLEPIPPKQMSHDRNGSPGDHFEKGRELVRALRCAACHEFAAAKPPLKAPALDRLPGNLHPDWLAEWLANDHAGAVGNRMPNFHATREQAHDITAYLFSLSAGKDAEETAPRGDVESGQQLFLTLGCLACHQKNGLGVTSLFDGGDLSNIAAKRPEDFFARWLDDPSRINRDHRMPNFELTGQENADLAAYLANDSHDVPHDVAKLDGNFATQTAEAITRGKTLIRQLRCAACHRIDAEPSEPNKTRIDNHSDWNRSCLTEPEIGRPGYRLDAFMRRAIQSYVCQQPMATEVESSFRGSQLLREHNCVSCHSREDGLGLGPVARQVTAQHALFASHLPAMVPPSLNSVGDKLHHDALQNAIVRRGEARRPWLLVRMPRFSFEPDELKTIIQHFVTQDRVPDDYPGKTKIETPQVADAVA